MKNLDEIKTFAELKIYVNCPYCWYTIDFIGTTKDFPEVCNYEYHKEICKHTKQDVELFIQKYNEIINSAY